VLGARARLKFVLPPADIVTKHTSPSLMASIDSVQSGSGLAVASASGSASSASGELAKCESQLSDWVHCPSSKTSAGKAKIAEIAGKIEAIKAQIKKAEDTMSVASAVSYAPPAKAVEQLRFDGLGSLMNAQA